MNLFEEHFIFSSDQQGLNNASFISVSCRAMRTYVKCLISMFMYLLLTQKVMGMNQMAFVQQASKLVSKYCSSMGLRAGLKLCWDRISSPWIIKNLSDGA